jgi:hypothetical protein
MRTAALTVLRVMALTIVLFICFAVAGAGVGFASSSQASGQTDASTLPLLAVCFLEVIVLTPIILASTWRGWRLVAAVFFVYYGVTTFMPQIESAVFITQLPPGTLPRLFLMGALIAAPFSVLAVVILGKGKGDSVDTGDEFRLVMPASEWAWKLVVIAATYLILYFTFGYFIAWRLPAVREYYGGIDPGSFVAQMRNVLRDTPWLVPFQIVRAMCWVALALPVIRMLRGKRPEAAIAIGLLFSVVMNAPLLLSNPYMPAPVRMAHLVETASSNLIFGAFVGWLLTQSIPKQRVSPL